MSSVYPAGLPDPLPSWNNGAAKQNIVNFVQAVTQVGLQYVPPEERIATFDHDGTLWTEKPMYAQVAFVFDYLRDLRQGHPKWGILPPFAAKLGNAARLGDVSFRELLEVVKFLHEGITTNEYTQIVTHWLATARHPRFGRRYTELAYQPMLELLTYLRANGFKTYIISGGGVEFVRSFAESVYGVPPEQVVGSSLKTKFEAGSGKPVLTMLPEINFVDDEEGKPEAINEFIGRRPIAAFGNSDGDLQMLQWTAVGDGERLMLLVHHTDAAREYAYDKDSMIVGHLDKALSEALNRGWIVVEMKKDWKVIYPQEQAALVGVGSEEEMTGSVEEIAASTAPAERTMIMRRGIGRWAETTSDKAGKMRSRIGGWIGKWSGRYRVAGSIGSGEAEDAEMAESRGFGYTEVEESETVGSRRFGHAEVEESDTEGSLRVEAPGPHVEPDEPATPAAAEIGSAPDWGQPEERVESGSLPAPTPIEFGAGEKPSALAAARLQDQSRKFIGVWISERLYPEPLRVGQAYTLNFKVGIPVAASLVPASEAEVSLSDIPAGGLPTEWVVSSRTVQLSARTDAARVDSTSVESEVLWTARFQLDIPRQGESAVVQLTAVPLSMDGAVLNVLIYARKELYRQFDLTLEVAADLANGRGQVVALLHDTVHVLPGELGLRPPHEWTTPPVRVGISVDSIGAHVLGDVVTNGRIVEVDERTEWPGVAASVAGPIMNVRKAAEKFRESWQDYLDDIDPNDLLRRLAVTPYQPPSCDNNHEQQWSTRVAVSAELRALAHYGYVLYQAFFPAGSRMRAWLDDLPEGSRIDMSWLNTAGPGWIPNVPWTLMYQEAPPPPGNAIRPLKFLGLRYRIGYRQHQVDGGSKALGDPAVAHGGHSFYWGNQPGDVASAEAHWQRGVWGTWARLVMIPDASAPAGQEKAALVSLLNAPRPSPMTVLYFFCHCDIGAGNEPILRFGSTRAPSDIVDQTETGLGALADRPLVFANACTTSASDPYIANELERVFVQDRGCRGFLGTETKVPIVLASRFAAIFFHYFYRRIDAKPMAAGEAVFQARRFLWDHYRNIGGLLYSYMHQYELVLAKDDEVARMRA